MATDSKQVYVPQGFHLHGVAPGVERILWHCVQMVVAMAAGIAIFGILRMARVDLLGMIMMASLFAGYLLGVRVLEVISARLRSIAFIKSVHTIVFVPLSGLLFVLVYEVVVGRITLLSWAANAVFLAEMVVLMTHQWRCPLTAIAERLGSTHGQITDFFFPKWFADRVFLVYGGLFAFSLVGLVIRLWS